MPIRFPDNYILGLTLATALVANGDYAAADSALATLDVLPYEGRHDGRVLYRQAKLMLAVQAIREERWDSATALIAAARLWPERLGAGKPYDADIDERLEDLLLADVRYRSGASTERPRGLPGRIHRHGRRFRCAPRMEGDGAAGTSAVGHLALRG